MPAPSLLRRPSVLLGLGLVAVAVVTTLLGKLSEGTQKEQKRVVLPDVNGAAADPVFSHDGNRLAYAQRGMSGSDVFHIVVRRLPTGAPQQLTNGDANDSSPAWSPDGSGIAFVRTGEDKSQLIAMPSAGGSERVLAEFATPAGDSSLPTLSWSPDGKTFVATVGGPNKQPAELAIIDASRGSVRPITTPPADQGDWNPEFSPDGLTVAFTRVTPDGSNVFTCAPDGSNLRQLTYENHWIHGVSWLPGGKEVLFSSDRFRDFTIWRMPVATGNPRATLLSPHGQFPAVALKSNRVAFTESPTVTSIWRATLDPNSPIPSADRAILRSQDGDSDAVYSPDGNRIAFLSAGNIWISDAEGANRKQVTKLTEADPSRPAWSPDGKWLLYEISSDQGREIYKVAAAAGAQPARIAAGGDGAAWAHDGKSIFYNRQGAIYEDRMDGSQPRAVTSDRRGRVSRPLVSADGKYIFYRRGSSFMRVPVKGGEPEFLFEPGSPFLVSMEAGGTGIYFEEFNPGDQGFAISLYTFDSKRITRVLRMESPRHGRGRNDGFDRAAGFSVSPDGKFILHRKIDQSQTNLVVVENFQ